MKVCQSCLDESILPSIMMPPCTVRLYMQAKELVQAWPSTEPRISALPAQYTKPSTIAPSPSVNRMSLCSDSAEYTTTPCTSALSIMVIDDLALPAFGQSDESAKSRVKFSPFV